MRDIKEIIKNTREYKKAFSDADEDEKTELIYKRIQMYSDLITEAVNPIPDSDIPYVIYALEKISEDMRLDDKSAGQVADMMKTVIGAECRKEKVRFIAGDE